MGSFRVKLVAKGIRGGDELWGIVPCSAGTLVRHEGVGLTWAKPGSRPWISVLLLKGRSKPSR